MITAHEGTPYPLGPSVSRSTSTHISVNFAAFSHQALSILIFPPRGSSQAIIREPLVHFPITSRTGDIYHIAIHNLPHHAAYAFHPQGSNRLVHDPYARFLECRSADEWNTPPAVPRYTPNPLAHFRSLLNDFPIFREIHVDHPFILSLCTPPLSASTFDWCNVPRPRIHRTKMVIYEAHVGALTRAGTFESAVEIIPYLKWLGITTLQLMPILEFDELETANDDYIREPNMWGYSPASWFMPMGRYSTRSAATGLKLLVRELHRAGMECILDVVYNHSAHASCPLHFFGVQHAYYIGRLAAKGFHHSNISGCGNTLSPNSPLMSDLIMESLRWFVAEYHIDGFRIDAAGVFCRDPQGNPINDPMIMRRVAADPLLRDAKIIVEGWDAGGQIGSPNMLLGRFPGSEIVYEWNPCWRDAVRKFWRGDGDDDEFCEALRGFPRFFQKERPHGACHGVNFIACHDGFCLADVVSYTKRINSDGYDEISFNCGAEGKTTDAQICARRAQQMRNMVLTLALSRGVPMILQGDELGFSKEGHSNTWNDPKRYACALPEKSHEARDHEGLVQFTHDMFKLRQSYSQLSGTDFHECVTWVGIDGRRICCKRKKKAGSGFIAFETAPNDSGEKLLVAFNGGGNDVKLKLPTGSLAWRPLVDTALANWRKELLINETKVTATVLRRSSIVYVGHPRK